MRLLLVTVLLLLSGAAASPVAPVQTILDAVPQVIDEAVRESVFDGSPDRAYAILDEMDRFVAGFDALPAWPDGAAVVRADGEVFAFAQEVVAAARLVPGEIAFVERGRAACDAWQGNATMRDVEAWGAWVVPSSARASAAGVLLAERAQALDGRLDVAPLLEAVDALDAWQRTTAAARACVFDAADRVGASIATEPVLVVVPATTWPGGSFQVAGTAPQPLRVDVEGIGAVDAVPVDGVFSVRFDVPADARLGTYVVDAGVTATVEVALAPSFLDVSLPQRVAVDTDVQGLVEVRSPVHAVGDVVLSGAHDAVLPLVDGAAPFSFSFDETGTFLVTFSYAGTDGIAPANTTRVVTVVEAGQIREASATTGTPIGVWVAAAGVFVVAVAAAISRWRPRRTGPIQEQAIIHHAPGDVPGKGLVAAVGYMHARLVAWGIIRPGTTPRAAAATLGLAQRPLRAFEQVRYGPYQETERIQAEGPKWVRDLMRRLRGGAP